jgi:hypothetical protein
MVIKKKAQSALEFLTTYGWAFLVILIMIGALSYFGVLDPSRFLPDKCLFGAGFGTCTEFTATTGGNSDILFKLINNVGANIVPYGTLNGSSVTVNGLSTACSTPLLRGNLTSSTGTPVNVLTGTGGQGYADAQHTWNTGSVALFNITGCTIAVGERPSVRITLAYKPSGATFTKTVDGDISLRRTS